MVHIILASAVLIAYLGRNKGKAALNVGFFVLFLFAALRYMYGNDYRNYLYEYNGIQLGWESQFEGEALFYVLNRLSPSFNFLIAVTSLIFVVAVYRLVGRNVSWRNAWISLFIFVISPYLFLMNLSAIRQCLAMVLFVVAVRYGMERKLIPYAFWVLTGALFHKSAVILLPVYFILQPKQFKRRYVLLVVGVMAVLLWFTNLNEIALWGANLFDDKNYATYAENGLQNSLRATLLTGISFVYVLMNMEKLESRNLVYAKLSLIGYALGILAFRMSMFTRIQMYFDIFTIVTIPTIMETVNAEGKIYVNFANRQETVWKCINKYVLPTLIVLVYFLRYYSFFTNSSWEAFFTYRTIFSAM